MDPIEALGLSRTPKSKKIIKLANFRHTNNNTPSQGTESAVQIAALLSQKHPSSGHPYAKLNRVSSREN
jgi:hypothetical protein